MFNVSLELVRLTCSRMSQCLMWIFAIVWENFLVHVENYFAARGRHLSHSFQHCKGTIF